MALMYDAMCLVRARLVVQTFSTLQPVDVTRPVLLCRPQRNGVVWREYLDGQ